MLNLGRLAILSALLSLSAVTSSLTACECCEPSNRFYIGGFGGGIYSNSSRVHQYGTAFFSEVTAIGPLPVIAEGRLNSSSSGFGGVQIGYEWSKEFCSDWSLATAIELEGFFYNRNREGLLVNQTLVDLLDEHDFIDSFHVESDVILANIVLAVNNDSFFGFAPYVGAGLGAIRQGLNRADSLQIAPPQPGINHFNSNPSDSNWTFAAQVKAGLRYNFCQMFHIFAEYRYLYVDDSHYVFGSTNYPPLTHVPTSPWNVKLRNNNFNAFAFGIQFDL